jgi:coproporphyrinogen III oxidase
MGRLELALSRGQVFEKATSIYCDLKIETPPVLGEKTGDKGKTAEGLVLELNLFPVNPRIPKGYMELRVNITDKIALAGGTDIFPYYDSPDDVSFFAGGMKELCARYGQDYDALRKARVDFFWSKYRNEQVGSHGGIYSFHLEEKDYPFFQDMAETFFALYGDLVEKHKGEPVTEKDREHMLRTHGVWAQWVMLEDSGTKFGLDKGIPSEALLGAILPPQATF